MLRRHASDVETELRHVLHPPGEEDPAALDERPERRESERSEREAFVPVAADVAPQLALFGGGAGPRPRRSRPGAVPAPGAADAGQDGDDAALPAWERRALLRDKRHRLVADLRRRDGRSHAEINGWLNRSCGIRRVNDASIEQLERSIELLLAELAGGGRRPAARR